MSFVRSQGFADLAVIQVPEAQPKMQNDNEEFLDVCSFVYVKDSLLPQVEGYMEDLPQLFFGKLPVLKKPLGYI